MRRHVPNMPAGWKPLWRDTLNRLEQAALHGGRRAILDTMYVVAAGDVLQVIFLAGEDDVLEGIAGKCERRSRRICRQCGAEGRLRVFDDNRQEVLCARCATPALLALEIERFRALLPLLMMLETIGAERVSPLLRRSFVRAANAPVPWEAEMGPEQLERWLSGLRIVGDAGEGDVMTDGGRA